jgi:hypothetical protein
MKWHSFGGLEWNVLCIQADGASIWLKKGKPVAGSGRVALSVMNGLKQIQTTEEADFICRELKKRGLIKSFIVTESKQDVVFPAYLQSFWDYESSPYVKEKLRKSHSIYKNYTIGQNLVVEKYWKPFFAGRLLGALLGRASKILLMISRNGSYPQGAKIRF